MLGESMFERACYGERFRESVLGDEGQDGGKRELHGCG